MKEEWVRWLDRNLGLIAGMVLASGISISLLLRRIAIAMEKIAERER